MDLEFLWDLIFPTRCISCGKYPEGREPLCASCASQIILNKTLFCGVCSARLPEGKKVCHKETQFILGGAASYSDETMRNLIYALKFNGVKNASVPLGNLMAAYIRTLPISNAVIVPIPLGRKRLKMRGYNQAELISKTVGEKLSVPISLALLRNKETKPQSGLTNNKLRKENVSDCFALAPGIDIKNKTVLLVDDVTTSQATFREAARALKLGGAKTIYAVAAAKA